MLAKQNAWFSANPGQSFVVNRKVDNRGEEISAHLIEIDGKLDKAAEFLKEETVERVISFLLSIVQRPLSATRRNIMCPVKLKQLEQKIARTKNS